MEYESPKRLPFGCTVLILVIMWPPMFWFLLLPEMLAGQQNGFDDLTAYAWFKIAFIGFGPGVLSLIVWLVDLSEKYKNGA